MKTVLLAIGVVVLMAASGGAGYYFGNANGLQSATNIQREFFATRSGNAGQNGGQGGTQGTGQGNAQNAQGGAAFGRPTASGVVKGVQGNTITVTQQDGSTTTVTVDDKTQYTKTVSGTLADVTAGLRITVSDQNNIKRIQLVPAASQ